jgi:Fe-Mn family superoxide dismutase
MDPLDRRNFLFASSGAAAGTLVVPGLAGADDGEKSPYVGSGLVTGRPKPPRHKEVPGFLSAAQITPHHTAHYGGALKAFAAADAKFEETFAKGTAIDPAAFERLKQIQSSRGNSVVLHELYFDGLALKATAPSDGIKAAIDKRFGSVDKWAADFVASAKAAAGWAMLVVHPVNGRLYNVLSDEHAQGPLWLAVPLVVIDVYEHAFYVDYQNKKAEYVEKFLKFVDWAETDKRYRAVVKG